MDSDMTGADIGTVEWSLILYGAGIREEKRSRYTFG